MTNTNVNAATGAEVIEQKTLDELQDLISYNIDSYNGFEEVADLVKDDQIASMFRDFARDRQQFADELQSFVAAAGRDPKDAGSARAKAHRYWIDMRARMDGGDTHGMLAEAERGEDAVRKEYEHVLRKTAGNPISDVLHRQYAQVKDAHDRVRALRDATKK